MKNSEDCVNILKTFSFIDDDHTGVITKEKLLKSIFFPFKKFIYF